VWVMGSAYPPLVLRLRRASLPLILLFATSCSAGSSPSAGTSTAHVSGPDATTDVFGNSRVTVRATADGVSDSFTVTAGRYDVLYRIDAGTDNGCEFSLILTPSKDGPSCNRPRQSCRMPPKARGLSPVR
jgi:hypothetical protein